MHAFAMFSWFKSISLLDGFARNIIIPLFSKYVIEHAEPIRKQQREMEQHFNKEINELKTGVDCLGQQTTTVQKRVEATNVAAKKRVELLKAKTSNLQTNFAKIKEAISERLVEHENHINERFEKVHAHNKNILDDASLLYKEKEKESNAQLFLIKNLIENQKKEVGQRFVDIETVIREERKNVEQSIGLLTVIHQSKKTEDPKKRLKDLELKLREFKTIAKSTGRSDAKKGVSDSFFQDRYNELEQKNLKES